LGENKDLRALVPTEELIVLSGEGDVGEPLTKAIDQKPEQIRVIGDEKNWPRYGPSLREKGIQAVYAREGFDVDWLVWAVLCADSAEEFNRLIKALEIPKEEADALREQMTQDGGVRPPLQVRSLMRDMELTRESADIRDESM
ncbi:MAG: hypothetical protein HYS07_03630, partial [Chlamydiae bacterium]|nr:hypothetical protein [Chlamydiota bacterium]MBI3276440.1 hypothetical protein [Chlamydiota bacterium]